MSDRPNVLLLFTDQQRGDTIRALGNPVIRTPNLDRLCERGVAFTNAFSPSPVCVSARCSMIYGQYPLHTGCYENSPMPMDERESFMGALTRSGYRTHGIGKCHFSPDSQGMRGFQTRERQEEMVGKPDRDDYLSWLHGKGFAHVCDPHGIRGEMYYVPQPSQIPAELHPTNWIGDRSVKFVREQAASDEPWFLFSSYVHPHPPFAPPNPWHKLYRAPLMPLPNVPPDFEALHTYINRHQNRYKYRDQGIDQNLLRCMKAYYYAAISFVDFQVGKILTALEETGQLENTLIIHTSDHGEHLGDYNCFGKRSFHDSCARIPMLVSQPGRIDGGTVCEAPASLVDVAATILGATGETISDHAVDGVDLAALASGDNARDIVFGQHSVFSRKPPEQRASGSTYLAATSSWKYIYSAPDNQEFLFDRVSDPRETRNQAGLPFRKGEVKTMRERLFAHLREGGETAGIEGDTWKVFPKMDIPADPDSGLLIQDHPWANTAIPGYTD